MAEFVYLLCTLTSMACAYLLLRGFLQNRTRLLLWSSICFGLLALNNLFLFVDLTLIPDVDFHGGTWRSLVSATASSLLLYGLIWELT